MKKSILSMALFALTFSMAQAQAPVAATKTVDKNTPIFQFTNCDKDAKDKKKITNTHNFGTVKDNEPAVFTFEFKNVGKTPLVISNCSASCGCTTPKWSSEPVLPGKKGSIVVNFNTAGKAGQPINKTVYIQSNAACDKERYELYITGNVIAATPAVTPAQKN